MQLLIEKDIFPIFSIAYETSIVIYGIYILTDQPVVQLMIHEFINISTYSAYYKTPSVIVG